MPNRVLYGNPAESEQAKRTKRSFSLKGLRKNVSWSWMLQFIGLVAAIGVVVWVYGGGLYLTLVIIACVAGIFIHRLMPDRVPEIVWWTILAPLALGALIPLWRIAESLFNQNIDGLTDAGLALGAYLIAMALLFWLPRRLDKPVKPLARHTESPYSRRR